MPPESLQQITVIGVGLLGGSVGLAVKRACETARVVGVGRRRSSLERALAAGAIDQATLKTAEGVRGSDLVVLATPLGAYERHLQALSGALAPGAVVELDCAVTDPVEILIESSCPVHGKKHFETAHERRPCSRFATEVGYYAGYDHLFHMVLPEQLFKRRIVESIVLAFFNYRAVADIKAPAYFA